MTVTAFPARPAKKLYKARRPAGVTFFRPVLDNQGRPVDEAFRLHIGVGKPEIGLSPMLVDFIRNSNGGAR